MAKGKKAKYTPAEKMMAPQMENVAKYLSKSPMPSVSSKSSYTPKEKKK